MMQYRLRKVKPPQWLGNGFGTSTAEWLLYADDTPIAYLESNGGMWWARAVDEDGQMVRDEQGRVTNLAVRDGRASVKQAVIELHEQGFGTCN